MFKRSKRQRRIKLELECTACGHTFKQNVNRVFVDMNAFEKNRGEPGGRSEYIIPLSDGTPMHPLDALDMYAEQVSGHPERVDLRVKYANTLRFLGYLEKASVQYRVVLEQDPTEVEALVNLAALHAGGGEKEAAYECLRRLIACAPKSRHPRRKEFARGARRVLDGEIELEDFRMESPVQPLATSARRPGSTPQRASGQRKKRKRRSR